jgi:D-sedoheptulose 7-phosphate isomerase
MFAEAEARRTVSDYLQLLHAMLGELDSAAVLRVGACLQRARDTGATIYLAGNGGSAATASHWANDLGKATKHPPARPIRVVSLSDHLSWLTALANDEGYDRVFSGQLENLAQPGDVLVVISASGNSPNLVEAVRTAQSHGAVTIGLLGFDGGVLKSIVDECIWLPTPKGTYGPVEDVHMIVCHLLTTCLASRSVQLATVGAAAGAYSAAGAAGLQA